LLSHASIVTRGAVKEINGDVPWEEEFKGPELLAGYVQGFWKGVAPFLDGGLKSRTSIWPPVCNRGTSVKK
jgi:hypothetical protein